MMPEIDTEEQQQAKDNETVVSETSEPPEESPGPISNNGSRKGRLIVLVICGIAVTALVVGLSVGLTKPPPLPRYAPTAFEGGGDNGLDYQLAQDVPNVGQAFYGDDEEMAYLDADTGCVSVFDYDSQETSKPLCNDFEDVRSVSVHDIYAVVAHGQRVEVWKETGADDWTPYPNQHKVVGDDIQYAQVRNPHIKRSDPGFGKKTAMYQNRVLIASDEHVYLFQKHGKTNWAQLGRWRAIGFDINVEQTTLAIYTATKVSVFDLSHITLVDSMPTPKVHHFQNQRIANVVVSTDDVNVVVESDTYAMSFDITHLNAGYITELGVRAKIAGDAVVSVNTGCLIDIASGSYFSVEVEDADEVYDVSAAGDRLTVFLSRDGKSLVEIYEK